MVLKDFNLIVLRENIQERAKQQGQYEELYDIEKMYAISVRIDKSKDKEETIDSSLETYIISLEVNMPTIQNLCGAIVKACPDLTNKKEYYLYWRYSLTKIIPISNYMSYLTALQLMANKNNKLYLMTRAWNSNWLDDPSARYVALPEDLETINMIAPKESAFTIYQEENLINAKRAGLTEYSKTYQSPLKTDDKKTNKKSKSKSSKGSKKKK